MEVTLKIFAVLLLFSVCNRGNAQHCSLSDLAVTQTVVAGKFHDQREFAVTVENRCICTQSNIKIACPGFASATGVDPAVLRPDGDGTLCTLNGGGALGMGPGYAVKFRYSSTSQIGFKLVSSTVNCS